MGGQCLPPLVQSVKEPWPSEGILGWRLNKSLGPGHAAHVFQAHRNSYIDRSDIRDVKMLGMKSVRVPIPWQTFADELAIIDSDIYGRHNGETDTVMVPDPYYTTTHAYATVPRSLL